MTFKIGSLVTSRFHGPILWVVKSAAEGGRWNLVAKQVDGRGRSAYKGHVAGGGDLTLVHDAESYQPGQTVTYQGLDHLVLEDRGDDGVWLGVPEHTSKTKGGELVRITGNKYPDLVEG